MIRKLKAVLLTVLPTVIYGHYDYDNEQNADAPFIVFQEVSKRPAEYGDDKPVHYVKVIQVTLVTKKKDVELEEQLEAKLLEFEYTYSLLTETVNSDHSMNRVYEIRLEEFKHAK